MNQEQLFTLTNSNVHQNEKIIVFGVGGGGGNALNHIIESNVQGVDFVAANTDARALQQNLAPNKINLGENLTRGLGAGANPQVGTNAAKESLEKIKEYITGADMLFVTAGMGGGTGTGAAPVIAETARDMGVLVVAVVTKPFAFEMAKRMRTAEEGIEQLKKNVDALLIVENEKLMDTAQKMKIVDAYKKVDEVLRQAVQGVTDLITNSGFVNVDFADIKAVLSQAGTAIMGMGEGEGEDRARKAAENALKSPLMTVPITGAKGILLNVTTGTEITLGEMSDAAKFIETTADVDAQVIWGHVIDESLGDKVHVTVIATFPEEAIKNMNKKQAQQKPTVQNLQQQQQQMGQAGQGQAPAQYQQQSARTGGSIYDIYNRNRNMANQGLQEANLTTPNNESGFPAHQRKLYDQPALFRKNNKN